MDQFQEENQRVGIIANPWLRLAAYFLDGIFLSIPAFILMAIFFGSTYMGLVTNPEQYQDNPEAIIPFIMNIVILAVCMVALQILYFAYFESSQKQATFGKQIVGIYVTDMNGERISFLNALGRYLSKILSGMIMYIGFLMILFTEKKSGAS